MEALEQCIPNMGRSSFNTISGEDNSELIPGLCNDITLDPIMTRLPWYTRSKMVTLSRAWRKALRGGNHYPYHSKEDAMRNSIILCNYDPFGGNGLVLKIFQQGIVSPLPPPKTIPHSCCFKFCLTDERIYYLICDNQGKKICHVEMLDLTNGLLEWQSLPPLTLDERKFTYIYATTGPDGNSTCMFMHYHIPHPTKFLRVPFQEQIRYYLSIKGKNCSVWQLPHGGEVQWHKTSSDFLTTLQDKQDNETQPPLFLDISDQCTLRRILYKRFPACDYSWEKFEQFAMSGCGPKYLLVFRDDYSADSLSGLHCFLHCGNEVNLFKLCPQRSTVIRKESEWNSFKLFWASCRYAAEEYDLTKYNLTALQFSADLSQQFEGWTSRFTLPFTVRGGVRYSCFNVSQQGYMHIYVRVAVFG
ncbi:uncharacterized protein LOC131037511 [Cryptomeria japonica]|uniref:uncharacterized protein LOC131037511 n=1 Tax=Cryptomeria japonica TaxID=3369 RepID=UPI0027DA6B15|nr:uncharacterized protein LOC131037511 [Cryptomeria japonica]